MTRKLSILAADDSEMNRRLLTRFITQLGHDIVLVNDGQAAVQYCQATRPDLILMDVMMPVMDGLEATRQIRSLLGEHWLPIIFLTAKADQEDVIQGLSAGGDDYLSKPIDITLLSAKINVMARIADMQLRIAQDAEQLEAYYRANEAEQELAKHVLSSLTVHAEQAATGVQEWIKPAVNFSGDVVAVERSPTGVAHIMLADSTGHGLSAAISCLPAVSAFHSMTQKGFAISAIAREINTQLHRSLPLGRFVAAILVAVDYAERIVSLWNGGLPAALLVDADGKLLRRFESQNAPLGILGNEDFDPGLAVYRWPETATLALFSDGLSEARNAQDKEFGEASMLQVLASVPAEQRMAAVRQAVAEHLDGREAHDDVSLVIIPCEQRQNSMPESAQADAAHTELADWEIRLSFGPRQLREDNCMPALLGWLHQINLNETQFGEVLLVMSELFNNALDHGVLKLSSLQKSAGEGFGQYMEERQRRLQALESGSIEIGMNYRVDAERALLRLWMKDSGEGFDFARQDMARLSDDGQQTHGRGLALVRRLCESVLFVGSGNQVEVEYALK
ncbi:SpoIIE family protein phosphatase [Chitinimonas sp.]|uniref:ATP-binding SpoIIE family protein phosphatase n=1 Tax=Chitinimonas sp. TaxID=1934313 RepID=UPI0035AFA9B6